MKKKSLLISTLAFIVAVAAFASGKSPDSGKKPRLPKGVPGLAAGQSALPGPNWLLDAKDDDERFRRIQIYAGGTHEQMWQIGYRYQQVYHAINDENWALARHHWRKIKSVFNVALMKRPKRTPNAEEMFLDSAWGQLETALRAGKKDDIRRTFQRERTLCMACHVAERMTFLNDTPIFRDTAAFLDK